MGAARSKEDKSETAKLEQSKTGSGADYGAVEGSPRRGSGVFVRRNSVTATSHSSFERPISSIPSGKSLASKVSSHGSIRTRTTSVSRQEYHEDLKVSLESGLNLHLVFTTFIIVFGSSFLFGWNIGVLNQPVDLIRAFYNETYTSRHGEISSSTITLLWSLTNAIFLPGGMFGAFLGGGLADKFGRKRTILFSHIFSISGGVLGCACVAAKAPELLLLARILFGINCGLGNCLAPMFLSEISPYNLRGALGTVHQLAITIGIALSSVCGMEQLLGTADKWPYLLLLEALPAFVSLICLPFLPDPPRFLLLARNDREQARKSLQFYRQRKDVTVDMEEMDTETKQGEEKGAEEEFTVRKFFRSRDLYRPLAVACMLQIIQQFSGINAVHMVLDALLRKHPPAFVLSISSVLITTTVTTPAANVTIFIYSKGIFRNANVAASQIEYAVIGTNMVNVLMTVITVPIMDLAGRRLLLLIPMVTMTVDLAIITMALNLQGTYAWMSYVSVACVIIYVIGFAVGLGPIPMMIGAELFRQAPRPLAMSTAGVVNWVATFIIAMSFESIQESLEDFTFLLFMGLMILFTIFTFFFVPETKNKTFEEIAHQFSPGAPVEVEEMLDDDDVFPEETEDQLDEHGERPVVNFNLGESSDHSDDEAMSNGKDSIPMMDKPDRSNESNIR